VVKLSRRGRPPKLPEELRCEYLHIRVTSDEKDAIFRMADLSNSTVSDWCRHLLLEGVMNDYQGQ